jgi:hypothetical protein
VLTCLLCNEKEEAHF